MGFFAMCTCHGLQSCKEQNSQEALITGRLRLKSENDHLSQNRCCSCIMESVSVRVKQVKSYIHTFIHISTTFFKYSVLNTCVMLIFI